MSEAIILLLREKALPWQNQFWVVPTGRSCTIASDEAIVGYQSRRRCQVRGTVDGCSKARIGIPKIHSRSRTRSRADVGDGPMLA
jgi:hypothetical protein